MSTTQPHGVCFCGPDGQLYPYTFVGRYDSSARVICEQKAEEVVPRAARQSGRVVPVSMCAVEER
jgi:hypothetical protein